MLNILESIQQPDQPRCLDSGQNISLYQNVFDLVHFRESTFSHLFEGTNLVGVGFASQVYRAIPTLTDLSNDAKLVDTKLGAALAEKNSLSSIV